VIDGFRSTGRKVVRSSDPNSSQNESEHLLLRFWEDGEDVRKLNLTKRRVKPIPVRNPDARVKNNFATPAASRVKGVSIV
jgi:hypothetical protein